MEKLLTSVACAAKTGSWLNIFPIEILSRGWVSVMDRGAAAPPARPSGDGCRDVRRDDTSDGTVGEGPRGGRGGKFCAEGAGGAGVGAGVGVPLHQAVIRSLKFLTATCNICTFFSRGSNLFEEDDEKSVGVFFKWVSTTCSRWVKF